MKKLTIVLCVLVTSVGFSQQRISKNLGDFNKLKVFSGLKVKLIESDEPRIEIKGNNSEDVVVKNVNGLLKLSVTLPHAFDEDQTLIRLYITNDLDLIDANEGAVITSDDALVQDYVDFRTQEGAKIEMRVKAANIDVKAVTGGVISLAGKATNQTIISNTGGVYEGFDLSSDQADVTTATGGVAEVNAKDLLEAKVRLQGTIIYKERPKRIIKKKTLGGKIVSWSNYNSNRDFN